MLTNRLIDRVRKQVFFTPGSHLLFTKKMHNDENSDC